VTNGSGSTLSVIQAATNTVSSTTRFGNCPGRLAFSPRGDQLYIINENSCILDILATSNMAVLANFEVEHATAGPADVAVSPDSRRVYVVSNFSNVCMVVDAPSRTFLKTLNVERPTGVAVSQDSARVYIAHQLLNTHPAHTISIIDTATFAVLKLLDVGNIPAGMVESPDGSRLYVTNGEDNTLSVVDTANLTVVNTVPVGETPARVATSPDGTRVYVLNNFGFSVSVFDAADIAG
jgi:YVTN family beta-propeller protein